MANTWFEMKQFTVHQPQAALKVGTDACLFGAWVGSEWQQLLDAEDSLLDIGTGTGLLSLMIRQLCPATLHAVEIDPLSYQDAKVNFEQSPWKEDFRLHLTDIRDFNPDSSTPPFKAIISNPPFFADNLRSPDARKNQAKHAADLPLSELLNLAYPLLRGDGQLALLLPANRAKEAAQTFNLTGWYIRKELHMMQTPRHAAFRIAYLLQKDPVAAQVDSILIKDINNTYSSEFQKQLAPFYLYL